MTQANVLAQLGSAGVSTGFKNRIINGAMTISQRGTSPTITGGGDCSVDRFYNYYSGPVYTSVQSTTAPAGFINSLKLTVTSPSASPTYSFFGQIIEGLNIADLAWGTADAKTLTYSFWVQSSVAGVYSFSFTNWDGSRAYPLLYTINAANTWQYVTATIPGDTSGSWLTTNGIGIRIRMDVGSPSARLGSSGSWQSGNYDGATGSTGASTWANTNGATFYITGVQLEVGTEATDFEYRPYGTELFLCQRYFLTLTSGESAPANDTLGLGVAVSSTVISVPVRYPTTMRTDPTIYSSLTAGDRFRVNGNVNGNTTSNPTIETNGDKAAEISVDGLSGLTTGYAYKCRQYNVTGVVGLDAEL